MGKTIDLSDLVLKRLDDKNDFLIPLKDSPLDIRSLQLGTTVFSQGVLSCIFILYSVYHKIHPKNGSIGFSIGLNLKITLNGSNEYIVYINDPRFSFPTLNPGAVPRTSFILSENTLTILYLKVTRYTYLL